MSALAAFAIVPAALLTGAPAAHAATVVSCTGGSGTVGFSRAVPTLLPADIDVSTTGPVRFAGCSGGGITDAQFTATGSALAALCLPVVDSFVVAGATGTLTVTWSGGSGPATTTVAWAAAAVTQVGPGLSAVEITGATTGGRFHNGVTPAVFTSLATVAFDSPCTQGATSATLAGDFVLITP
ncbi:hypothetical protein ACIQV3_39360 [Streptomyces sp. NPDC099050]|uniref:hypothetical protein n=1 Tax=Streptomyces sp. NPDC099050 TaxID=3366100 RepID=UPI003815D462